MVGLAAAGQRLLDARRQSLLASARQVQLELAVHAPQHGLATRLILVAGTGVQQIKPMSGIDGHIGLDELNNPGVIGLLVAIAQGGAGDAAGYTGFALAHAVLSHERLHHIGSTLRGQSFRSMTSFKA